MKSRAYIKAKNKSVSILKRLKRAEDLVEKHSKRLKISKKRVTFWWRQYQKSQRELVSI